MKKIVLLLLVLLPVIAFGKKDDSKYLKGAVPEENGLVVFHKSFRIKSMTEEQLYNGMFSYVKDTLVAGGIQDAYARMLTDGSNGKEICARCEEWLVFRKKFLYLDQTRLRYQINVTVKGNTVDMTVTQISYLYGEDFKENKPTGEGGERYRAEEWISDKCALNKAGNKLLPLSGKFRRKTVDRMDDIFTRAMDMFENRMKAKTEDQTKKVEKKRKFVED